MRLRWVAAVGCLTASLALTSCGGSGGGTPGAGNPAVVSLLTATIPNATTGVAYSTQFQADFPHAPGRYVLTAGALPPGLSLNNQDGTLDGYPRQVGTFHFEVGARDGLDPALNFPGIPNRDATFAEDRREYAIVVTRGPPNILPQQPPGAQYRASYGYQIDVAGGLPPYTFELFSAPSTLPGGMSISPTGLLGTFPTTETPTGDPFEFDVKVTDANGDTDIEHLTLDVVILPLLILTPSPMIPAAQGFAYNQQLQLASAGGGQPITWEQVTPGTSPNPLAMPPPPPAPLTDSLLAALGMEITPTGILRNNSGAGVTAAPGTYTFTIKVTDQANQVAWRAYSIRVNAGPVLISINPKKSVASPPFIFTGSGFQLGAQLIFKPGASQSAITPNAAQFSTVGPNTIFTIGSVPPAPGGGGGLVSVMVLNPDGGFFTLPNAFAFPASNLTFDGANPVFPTPQTSLSSTGIAAADLNGDGFCDLVHVGSQGSGSWSNAAPSAGGVHLMLNTTPPAGPFTGSFNQIVLDTGVDYEGVKLFDVDADNDKDIVAMCRIGGQLRIRVWKNPFPAAYSGVTPFVETTASFGGASTSFHLGNVDMGRISASDSVPDIAYTIVDTHSTSSSTWFAKGGSLTSMAGSGTGTFTSQIQSLTRISDLYAATGLVVANFNNDTKEDVFVGDQAGGYGAFNWGSGTQALCGQAALTNTATGLFGTFVPLSRGNNGPNEIVGVSAGDLNGDGNVDLVAGANGVTAFGGASGLAVFQGNGSGGFSYVAPAAGAGGKYRFSTPFDGDFDIPLDLATTVAENKIDIYKGRALAAGLQFKQTITLSTGSPKFGRLAAGDFNNDGRDDIVAAMSFFMDARNSLNATASDRGNGSPTGVVFYLNTSQ